MSLPMVKCGPPAPYLSSRLPVIPASEPGSSIGWYTWTPDQVRGDTLWGRGDKLWVWGDTC
jgi:hypothetical protein